MKTGNQLMREVAATKLTKGQAAFWWLGQHSFALKLGEAVLFLDPFLTPMDERLVPPLLTADEMSGVAIVTGSHDHGDHIDRPAWPAIAKAVPEAAFVVPEAVREKIVSDLGLTADRVRGLDLDRSVTIGGVTVHGVPAAHEFLDQDENTGLHPYLGFVLEGNGVTVYHAGDTCIYEGIQSILRRWQFDLAFLPINGRDAKRFTKNCIGNMTYQEAADLAWTLRPGLTVPTHFEMFAMNSEDPTLFFDYVNAKYPGLRVHVPEHGKRVMVSAQVITA